MKHLLLKTWLMLVCLLVGAGTMWATDVTYTVTSTSAVSTTGTAPRGSSATFANTYSTKDQLTGGNTMTLTLSGFAGQKITGITLSMHSNAKAGAGYLSVKAGSTTLASIGSSDSGVAFNNASWNGSYTSTYTNVTPTMSNSSYTIQNGENVVIVIGATANSLFCQSFKITYEDAGAPTLSSIAVKTAPTKTTYVEGETFNPAGLVITKTMSDANTADVAYSGNESSFTFSPSLTTELTNETSVSITYGKKTTTQAITVNPFVATAGTYTISTNNGLYGVSTGNNGTEQSVTKKGITIVSGCTSSATSKTYYDTDHIRYYADSYLKLTAPAGFEITKVVFTANGTWNSGPKCGTNGTYNNTTKTWEGSTSQLDLTFSDQNRIKSIAVTYAAESTDPEKELIGIEATGTPSEFWKGDVFNHNGITVKATWDDETETDVTSSCSFTGYDMSTPGQQTVTVTYQEETCQYNIEVKTIANTQAEAYTVAEAKALIDAGKDLATQVYVKGTVSQIVTAWSDQYNNITYAISDDGETSGTQFQLYRCATNGAEVGDDVVAFGTLTKHSDTYEFAAGNTIVDIQKPAAKTITALAVGGTPTKTNYNVGDAFETAGLVVTATYSDDTQEVISTGFEWEIDYGTGNEALVAGATSVDVMVYTEDQEVMSEVYTVNGLTVTVPVTLSSIAVSGTPNKTSYYVGDAFETAGLVVTGTYSDSHQETITEGIEWTVDPETLTLGTTSVDVMAAVGSVVSELFTVNDLTVTKAPFETVTYDFSSFTSGQSVGLTDLDGFTITLNSNGGTNPAWSSNQARVYAKGSLTVKADNATIKSIEYSYVVNANSKGITPTIDGVAGTTDEGTWDEENKTWTGADEEVTFSTSGTAGNIGFTKLIIKYVESDKIIPTLSFSAPTAEVTIGANDNVFPTLTTDPVDLAGVTYESSNTDVATIDENTGVVILVAAGETTITASYAGNEDYKAATPASYTLTVVKAPFVPTPAPAGYEVVDFAALYSSVTTNATVEDYEGTSLAMAFAKPQSSTTPTKYYDNGKAVRAYEGNTITITAAEPITSVVMNWSVKDNNVSITGLGTTTAVVTFSMTCRFTAIAVDYRSASISIASACTDGEKCYSTYSNAASWVVPAELTVSEIGITDGTLNVVSYATGAVVPANTGVMVSAAEGGNYTVALTANAGTSVLGEDNCLRPTGATGINAEAMAEADENCTYYRLTMHNGKTIGFWWGEENGAAFSLAANKAYLAVPKSAGSNLRLWFGDDTLTGIDAVETTANDAIFNLQGQRINRVQKGVNIVNGKKVLR